MIKLLIGLFLSSFIFCHSFCLAESGNPVIDGKTAIKIIATDFDITSITDGYIPYVASGEIDKSPIYTDGTKIGRGTTTLDENVHWEVETAKTNSRETILRLTHTTTGTPAAGIGVGLEFEQETTAGNEVLGTIDCIATDVGAGVEDGDFVFNLMTGGAAASEKARIDSAGNILLDGNLGTAEGSYNSIVGSVFAAKTGYVYNNIAGNNVANSAIGDILLNNVTGHDIANSATGAFNYNMIAGKDIASGSLANVYLNLIAGRDIAKAATSSVFLNLMAGQNIANAAATNVYQNLIVGDTLANVATGDVLRNMIVGSSICSAATGNIWYNLMAGANHATTVTGTIAQCFLAGNQCLHNTTNVTNLSRIVAMPYQSLAESSAGTLDDAIAIGYKAGYQNLYNSPCLLGREATAGVHKQIVIGSTFYTGGTALMGGDVGVNTTAPTAKVDINSDILRLRTAKTPASAGAAGNSGDICWDASFLYVCTATNTWRRIAHAAW